MQQEDAKARSEPSGAGQPILIEGAKALRRLRRKVRKRVRSM
jgi:hypothetical protein